MRVDTEKCRRVRMRREPVASWPALKILRFDGKIVASRKHWHISRKMENCLMHLLAEVIISC